MRTGSWSSTDSENIPLIRERSPRFGLFLALVVVLFEGLRLGAMAFGSGVRFDSTSALALVSFLFCMAVFVLGRSPQRSLGFVQNLEALGFLGASLCHLAMMCVLPASIRPELGLSLGLVLILLTRGIYIPSSVRRTLTLSVLVGAPFLSGVFFKYTALENVTLPLGDLSGTPAAIVMTAFTGLFWVISTAVAACSSHVLYGLRRQVRNLRQLGQYDLEEKLGEGGMGVVYRASHALLRRPTAIKLLPPDKLGNHSEQRFEREVQLTARLSHPNTVTVFDFGRTPDGVFYYAMELLEGADLGKVIGVSGPMPPARVAKIMAEVAGALAEAHKMGLVHRDIKTANIMLCWRGGKPDVTKVLDFGLAKDIAALDAPELTASNVLTGTPLYMPPEMVTAPDTVSPASDLYALGCVGYFLLTGETVFAAPTAVEVAAHHVRTQPVPPSQRGGGRRIPEKLEQLIMSCLEKDPKRRPASAADLERDLLPLAAAWTEEHARRFWAEYGERLVGRCTQPQAMPGPLSIDMQGRDAWAAAAPRPRVSRIEARAS